MHSLSAYEENANDLMMEQFVLEHHQLVKKISLYIKRRLPSHVTLEDLMQSGFVALLEARKSYQDNMGTTFETYASIRIRGTIIDSLRKNSWCTRESSKHMREIAAAISKLEQQNQAQPSTEEIIEELGMTPEEYGIVCQQISVCNVLSLELVDSDNDLLGDESENPLGIAQEDDLKSHIKDILSDLPEREQLVLSLYYLEEFTFKQIGETLDLTEARVCQLHSQSIARIRTKMRVKNM